MVISSLPDPKTIGDLWNAETGDRIRTSKDNTPERAIESNHFRFSDEPNAYQLFRPNGDFVDVQTG
jgi:hypothetical protein